MALFLASLRSVETPTSSVLMPFFDFSGILRGELTQNCSRRISE